jgi:hypothetical protein
MVHQCDQCQDSAEAESNRQLLHWQDGVYFSSILPNVALFAKCWRHVHYAVCSIAGEIDGESSFCNAPAYSS